jgi:hypothetical protein
MGHAGIAKNGAKRAFGFQSPGDDETFAGDGTPPHFVLAALTDQATIVASQESVKLSLRKAGHDF